MGCMRVYLNEVNLGQSVCIVKNSDEFYLSKRLIELGFYSGIRVKPLFSSLVKGSRAYDVCGTVVALRDKVAEKIEVSLVSDGEYEE